MTPISCWRPAGRPGRVAGPRPPRQPRPGLRAPAAAGPPAPRPRADACRPPGRPPGPRHRGSPVGMAPRDGRAGRSGRLAHRRDDRGLRPAARALEGHRHRARHGEGRRRHAPGPAPAHLRAAAAPRRGSRRDGPGRSCRHDLASGGVATAGGSPAKGGRVVPGRHGRRPRRHRGVGCGAPARWHGPHALRARRSSPTGGRVPAGASSSPSSSRSRSRRAGRGRPGCSRGDGCWSWPGPPRSPGASRSPPAPAGPVSPDRCAPATTTPPPSRWSAGSDSARSSARTWLASAARPPT